MKSSKDLTIKIITPCNQDWAQLSTAEGGRFCESCNKTVTDFTGLSDQELISVIAQTNGNSCGRFHISQLNRQITPIQQNTFKYNFKKLLTPLLFLPFVNPSDAHSAALKQSITSVDTFRKKTEHTDKSLKGSSQLYIIRGRVYDSSLKVGLEGVSVMVNNKYGCTTVKDGVFQLELPHKYLKRNFSIRIASVGYNFVTVKVENKKGGFDKELTVYLHPRIIDESEVIIVGGYSVD